MKRNKVAAEANVERGVAAKVVGEDDLSQEAESDDSVDVQFHAEGDQNPTSDQSSQDDEVENPRNKKTKRNLFVSHKGMPSQPSQRRNRKMNVSPKISNSNNTKQSNSNRQKLSDAGSSSTDSSTEKMRKERRYKSTAPAPSRKRLASRSPSPKRSVDIAFEEDGATTADTKAQQAQTKTGGKNNYWIRDKKKSMLSREIRNEKKLEPTMFCEFGLDKLLQQRGLWDNLVNVGPYNVTVIREFYGNVIEETGDPDSGKFGLINLRGKIYNFTPKVVNALYGLPTIKETDLDMSGSIAGVVLAEITGGKVNKWSTPFPSTTLTWKYAVLHKIAVASWMPSSNSTILTKDQAIFIYRVGCGLPFNFGQMVFDAVMKNALDEDASIIFPSLIYQVLRAQNFDENATGQMCHETKTRTFSRKLLASHRFKDLPYVPTKEKEIECEDDPLFHEVDKAFAELNEEGTSAEDEAKKVLSSLPTWIQQAEQLVQALKGAKFALQGILADS